MFWESSSRGHPNDARQYVDAMIMDLFLRTSLGVLTAGTVLSCGSDFLLAAFPILLLRKVQISLRVKVALCALMGLGVLYVSSV